MNDVELAAFVGSLSYKPGWKLSLGPTICAMDWNVQPVFLRATLPSSSNPSAQAQLLSQALIPSNADLHTTAITIYDALHSVEQHEIMEWFRSNGVPVFDPHPTGVRSFATRPARPGEVIM